MLWLPASEILVLCVLLADMAMPLIFGSTCVSCHPSYMHSLKPTLTIFVQMHWHQRNAHLVIMTFGNTFGIAFHIAASKSITTFCTLGSISKSSYTFCKVALIIIVVLTAFSGHRTKQKGNLFCSLSLSHK